MLARIQNDLFDLGADLSTPEAGRKAPGALRIVAAQVERLEREIDAMNAELQAARLVRAAGRHAGCGLSPSGADHGAPRRAARRRPWPRPTPINPEALKYLNRLSDHLFVMSRHVNDRGARDVLWQPGAFRS